MSYRRHPDLIARAWALSLDVTTAEVHHALAAAGVRSILLKGPAIAAWLYDEPTERRYTDIDLLVARESLPTAGSVLAALGFAEPYAGVGASATADDHAQIWRRGHPRLAEVDLHHRFAGIAADDATVWQALTGQAVGMAVAGREVETLDEVGLTLIVALHAAAHGPDDAWPREDLARALAQASPRTWAAAADLARGLGAEQSFALGLRQLPEGVRLAQRLALTTSVSTHAVLLSGGVASRGSWGFHQFAVARGWRARLRVLREKAAPSRAFMRHWAPWTRRGPLALTFGYGWRLMSLLRAAPRGARRYQAARTAANPSPTGGASPASELRVALWTVRCVRRARAQFTASGLNALRLDAPPAAGSEAAVRATTKALGASCLVEAAVRQAWHAGHGDARDLVIGVSRTPDELRAHAWLDGDPDGDRAGFVELARKPSSYPRES